jgi:hypothetical protein
VLSTYVCILLHQLLTAWTSLYETWRVYHGTWAHINVILHKSLSSVCVSVCVSPNAARQRLVKYITAATNSHATTEKLFDVSFLCGPCHIKESRRLVLPRTYCCSFTFAFSYAIHSPELYDYYYYYYYYYYHVLALFSRLLLLILIFLGIIIYFLSLYRLSYFVFCSFNYFCVPISMYSC